MSIVSFACDVDYSQICSADVGGGACCKDILVGIVTAHELPLYQSLEEARTERSLTSENWQVAA